MDDARKLMDARLLDARKLVGYSERTICYLLVKITICPLGIMSDSRNPARGRV